MTLDEILARLPDTTKVIINENKEVYDFNKNDMQSLEQREVIWMCTDRIILVIR